MQDFLEESILSISDEFGDFIQSFLDTWRENLDQVSPYIENSIEVIEKIKNSLSLKFDFWDTLLRDLGVAFSKLQTTYKTNPLYLEFFCKMVKRMLENEFDLKLVKDYFTQCVDGKNMKN